ncbi:unnamed protein product, partial [Prorocentrum cordatum]
MTACTWRRVALQTWPTGDRWLHALHCLKGSREREGTPGTGGGGAGLRARPPPGEDDEEDLEPGPTTKFELITLDDWEPAAQQAGGLRNEFSCEKIEPSADPENSRGPSTVSVYEAVHRVYWAKDDDHVDNDNDELM